MPHITRILWTPSITITIITTTFISCQVIISPKTLLLFLGLGLYWATSEFAGAPYHADTGVTNLVTSSLVSQSTCLILTGQLPPLKLMGLGTLPIGEGKLKLSLSSAACRSHLFASAPLGNCSRCYRDSFHSCGDRNWSGCRIGTPTAAVHVTVIAAASIPVLTLRISVILRPHLECVGTQHWCKLQ